jgi:hypothetical protein
MSFPPGTPSRVPARIHQGRLEVISGGQTGVDRAALDAAMARGLAAGGWCPRGRRAEDGTIPEHYPLAETPLARVVQRTFRNVRDSDATLVLIRGRAKGGTLATVRRAAGRRPLLVLDPEAGNATARARAFVARHRVRRLNVAGPRESEAPGVYRAARRFLERLFSGPNFARLRP